MTSYARFPLFLALATFVAMSGCQRIAARFAPEDPGTLPARPDDSCGSAQYRSYIGRSAAELGDLVMTGPVRMIPEGSAVTMDYNPVRVNFDISGAGTVTRIWCG